MTMISANGENRRYLAITAAAAIVTAVATKLGEWAIEEVRKAAKRPGESPKNTTGA